MAKAGVEISGPCPYCQFVFAVVIRDIRGERHVLRCQDCKQPFAVEAVVPRVELRTHAFAGIDVGKVLDELSRPRAAEPPSAAPAASHVAALPSKEGEGAATGAAVSHTPPAAMPKSGEAQKVATADRGLSPATGRSPSESNGAAAVRSPAPRSLLSTMKAPPGSFARQMERKARRAPKHPNPNTRAAHEAAMSGVFNRRRVPGTYGEQG